MESVELTFVLLKHGGGMVTERNLTLLGTYDTLEQLEKAAQANLNDGCTTSCLFYLSVPGPGKGPALVYQNVYHPVTEWRLA